MKPEILRSNLANVILQLKAIGINDIHGFDFLDKPVPEAINNSLEILKSLHALDKDFTLTSHGKEMAELPLDPIYSHLLLMSLEEKYQCSDHILSIIAVLTAENLFFIPKDHKTNLAKVLEKFKYPNSDHLTKLNIFNKFLLSQNKKSFCKQNLLNKKSIKRALMIRHQLNSYLDNILSRRKNEKVDHPKKLSMNENLYSYAPKADFDEEKILKCLSVGLQTKSAKLNAYGTYTLKSNQTANIHPESIVFYRKKKPENIIYNEVIITKKTYLRDVSEVPNVVEGM